MVSHDNPVLHESKYFKVVRVAGMYEIRLKTETLSDRERQALANISETLPKVRPDHGLSDEILQAIEQAVR